MPVRKAANETGPALSASELEVSQCFMSAKRCHLVMMSIAHPVILVIIVSSNKCFCYIEDDRSCCVTEFIAVRGAALTRSKYVLKNLTF